MARNPQDPEEIKKRCEQLERRVETLNARLASLLEISGLLASAEEPQPVFDAVLDGAIELTGASEGALMLIEQDSLRVAAASGRGARRAGETGPKLGEGVAGWVAEHSRPLLLVTRSELDRFAVQEPAKDVLGVPLRAGDITLGVLQVKNSREGRLFGPADLDLLSAFATEAALGLRLLQALDEKERAYLSIIQALAEAIDAKDPYTAGHSRRVRDYAVRLARLLGISQDETRRIGLAALLHDLGKIGINEDILRKPMRLDRREYGLIRTHPVIGAKILEPVPSLRRVLPIIRHHHERYDGEGYPAGLRGEEIPLGARILAVADAFDGLASGRAYRPIMSLPDVIKELRECGGRNFDPRVLDTFLQAVELGQIPIGAAVIRGQEVGRPPLSHEQIEDFLSSDPETALAIIDEATDRLLHNLEGIAGGRLAGRVRKALAVVAAETLPPAREPVDGSQLHRDCRLYFHEVYDNLSQIVGDRLTERLVLDTAMQLPETGRDLIITILREIGVEPPRD